MGNITSASHSTMAVSVSMATCTFSCFQKQLLDFGKKRVGWGKKRFTKYWYMQITKPLFIRRYLKVKSSE